MWKGRRLWNVRAGRGQVPCRPGLAGVGMGMGIRTGEVAAGRLMWWLPCPHLTPPPPCSPRSTPPLLTSLLPAPAHLAPPHPYPPHSPSPLLTSLRPAPPHLLPARSLPLSPPSLSLPLSFLSLSVLTLWPPHHCLSFHLLSVSPLSLSPLSLLSLSPLLPLDPLPPRFAPSVCPCWLGCERDARGGAAAVPTRQPQVGPSRRAGATAAAGGSTLWHCWGQ